MNLRGGTIMAQFKIWACVVAVGIAAVATPAVAGKTKPLAYIGTWATSLAGCKAPADKQDAPVVLTEKDYNQFESHCTWDKTTYRRYAWHAKVACVVSGDKQDETLAIAVSGDAMTLTWGGSQSTVHYARCK
jgi:hypothetical protein